MRYFIEVAYDGARYCGFQVQENANTIQAEVERALSTFYGEPFALTGSSRTDTGVHALQNFFHFDTKHVIKNHNIYNLNAILPEDIVIQNIFSVPEDAHCRFQATYRKYQYFIYRKKNPFLRDQAWFYPYTLNIDLLNEAARVITEQEDFTSFSKRNTQVKTKLCKVEESFWEIKNDQFIYTVRANRFLRGMVRGLVATMLQVGRGKISIAEFINIIEAKDCSKADFSAPGHGLFLVEVGFPNTIFSPIN